MRVMFRTTKGFMCSLYVKNISEVEYFQGKLLLNGMIYDAPKGVEIIDNHLPHNKMECTE